MKQEGNKEEGEENTPVGLSQLIGNLVGDDPLLIVLAVAIFIIIIFLLTDLMLGSSLIGRIVESVERLLGGR